MRLCALVALAACGHVGFDPTPARDSAAGDAGPAGPIAWWKLDEGSGTTAADASGNGSTGTLQGVTWATGHLGEGVMFPGVTDTDVAIGTPAILDIGGSMTITAWANAASFHLLTNFDDVIISRDDRFVNLSGWSLKGTEDCDNQQHFALQLGIVGPNYVERCTTMIPTTGVWYHVAGVYDAQAQTIDLYVDGVLDDGIASGAGPIPSSQQIPTGVGVQLGDADANGMPAGGGNTFHGIVDDVRVYARALTPAEVAALAAM
jgi:hypothetical protein